MTDSSGANRWLAADRSHSWEAARVVDVIPDTTNSVTLRLRLPEPTEILAGQYYLVRVAIDTPPGSVEQAYSVSSAPDSTSTEIEITVREVDGGRASRRLVREVHSGDLLQVRGPFGFLTWTEYDGGPLGLVGAGSGVAPLVSIVREAGRRDSDVPMTMVCSSRDRSTVLLRGPLEDLSREQRSFTLVHTFTRSADDPYANYHRRIDAAMLAEVMSDEYSDVTERSFYVAGPGPMVLSVQHLLVELGVSDERIYTEDHA